jgi:hypothetical protein
MSGLKIRKAGLAIGVLAVRCCGWETKAGNEAEYGFVWSFVPNNLLNCYGRAVRPEKRCIRKMPIGKKKVGDGAVEKTCMDALAPSGRTIDLSTRKLTRAIKAQNYRRHDYIGHKTRRKQESAA